MSEYMDDDFWLRLVDKLISYGTGRYNVKKIKRLSMRAIKAYFYALSPFLWEILILRYHKKKTLAAIGRELNMTPQGVRSHELKAYDTILKSALRTPSTLPVHCVYWTNINSNTTNAVSSDYAYLGSKSLRLTASAAGGIYSGTATLATGETWTFSAYVKTTSNSTAYLAISDGNAILASSEILKANSDWTRLEVSYTNGTSAAQTIRAQLMSETAGILYMDCTQFEATETASRYNLVENGDFRFGITNWTKSSDCDTDEKVIAAADTATPLLTSDVFQIVGDPEKELYIQQTIPVSGVEDDTFVLAGWAKAAGVPLTDDTRAFAIQGTFVYTDGEEKDFTFGFNPDTTDSSWQYAAGVMVAEKAYSSITIRIRYDYNANTALFDGIQLYKEEFGSSYTYDADGNVTSVKDLQAQTTTYEYENNDLTEMTLPTGAKLTYEYDDYHNVKTATTAENIVYTFTYDDWGNNTSVSIKSGDSTITSTAAYSSDGNRLVSTTDALGKTTTYSYHADTNILEWVQYPEDTDQTRTAYSYDSMYRLASAAVTTDTGSSLSVNYTYEDDLLTQLETESTTYTFAYGDFALRSSIKIGSRTLAEYSYTEDGNNYLSTLDYGNEDMVEYTYDKYGRLETQIYEDGDAVVYKYDNNGALATVTDSDGFTTKYYYDFTNRLMKYVESGEDYNHSVAYTYDTMNNLTALVETINGTKFVSSYGYNDDNVLTSVTNGSQTWAFEYDSYGRLSGIDGSPFDRTYNYHSVSDSQLTAQLSSIGYPSSLAGQTYAYTYDDNGNIVSVTFGDDSYSYVYDSQNQLIRENNSQLGRTYTWTYDNAGNILSRSTYAYTTGELGTPTATIQYRYEDADWGDLLTGIASLSLTYDEIGNMLTFGPRSFTWEHGRQLESQTINGVTWTYSYNMDGMRTGRTNGTTSYEYIYNGSQLMRMIRNGVVVDFSYINGIPATISFNGNTFYYIVNGQGDVTGITDSSGNLQITYYYDAWGSAYCTYDSTISPYAQSLYDFNPLMYRGYVFDREVGMYYLQSRYYIPEIGRFLNADGLVSTGQGILGNNMFAYCGNNPVCRSDPSGYLFLKVARDLLFQWLNGDGSPQTYGKRSSIVKALKKSARMQSLINNAIKNYKRNGIKRTEGYAEFTAEDDGWDLYLSTQHFSYKIDVKREIRTKKVFFWTYHEDRYVATVQVSDTYDFDPKPWEGIGNTLNNIAWILNVGGGVGNDYKWTATYTYKTDWEHFRYA